MRRRAILSVRANLACPDDATAERAVNEVWESCFNDTRPFDEVGDGLHADGGIALTPSPRYIDHTLDGCLCEEPAICYCTGSRRQIWAYR